ncbi:transketolase [Legionella jamestowniensis]|uniref:Transketolase n=1 Tax=Legionella jamestowniensis TaxID=455 RepID=A0A0W0UJ42_9GAMM|nr:transketolase [Legionella jamestowniensis]KTD07921.1 transketolase [Legionella jamestowniensis]SFL64152.1 transketolase [Legionella jamestowniensis DSM 19215]
MSLTNDLANAIRFLSIDAVEQAQSGHPGMPLGMAEIATVLWTKFLKHNPKNPKWFNRDRFVLSNGHGSMLLYSLLHLTGYNLSLEELKRFRQLNSKTPGHPEHDTPGVETTTGPLGQGLANSVGMAIAEKVLATRFNRPGLELINHYTYTFVGDGCLMEGISHEACSLAGTLGLGKLIVFYDDNGISIDGKVESWFTDDTATRFKGYNWQVIGPIDGHDAQAVEHAIEQARQETKKPSLIICKTIIGYGSPLAGSEKCHGAPLGAEGVAKVREIFNWAHPPFVVPDSLYAKWNHEEQGQHDEARWLASCHAYQQQHENEYHEFLRQINGDLPDNWDKSTGAFIEQCRLHDKSQATRKSSQQCIEQFAKLLPEMLGGSADLTGSNNTDWSGSKAITASDFSGNYLFYGVREFAMAAIMNGLALHGGIIPYGGTFLVFADYARNAIRLSALMQQRVIYVLTHDSIGLGEDGPTHQPIEHAAMLRMTPNLLVWRPADLMETAVAWQQALEHHNGPSALLLSRQNLPALPHDKAHAELIKRGGYILQDCQGTPDAILLATGSEVQLAVAAAQQMQALGKKIRVVSMPCCERFIAQEDAYQEHVLPKAVRRRVAIEAAAADYWYRFVGLDGKVVGLRRFGVSAPAKDAFEYLGITEEQVISALNTLF